MSGKFIVGFAIIVVFSILCAGLYTLWKGGDVSATWSNRLMRYRIAAQFVAIIIIMLVLFMTRG